NPCARRRPTPRSSPGWSDPASGDLPIVFQVLPHTLGVGPEVWRVLARRHDLRNRGEYEGDLYVDERLLTDLIAACKIVGAALRKLPPVTCGKVTGNIVVEMGKE